MLDTSFNDLFSVTSAVMSKLYLTLFQTICINPKPRATHENEADLYTVTFTSSGCIMMLGEDTATVKYRKSTSK